MEVYRWDLDKTYLKTEFESVRGLFRAATEAPADKRNVPGSAALMRALGARPGSRIVILSGSPTQMREKLEAKLRLDGVRWDELHLKDNLGNLRRGRIRAIRGQLDYKLPTLLRGRVGLGPAVSEVLFGDDAEVDAVVYSLFAEAVAGRVSAEALSRVMEGAGAYPDRVRAALDALDRIPPAEAVDRIFIHLDRGVAPQRFAALGSRVIPVFSWFQAALVLFGSGRLGAAQVLEVTKEASSGGGYGSGALANLLQDIARRGHVALPELERLTEDLQGEELAQIIRRSLDLPGFANSVAAWRGPQAPARVDWLAQLKELKE